MTANYEDFYDFWNKKWINITQDIGETDFAKKVLNYFPNPKNVKLIDIGSGTGRDSLFFARNNFEVESLDFSQNALEKIQKFGSDENLSLKLTLGDVRHHSFGENSYDVVYACNSLHYFSLNETKSIINNIKKSLKKGGYFFLRVKSTHDVDFGKGEKLEENFYKNGRDIKYYFTKEILGDMFLDFEIYECVEKLEHHEKISGEISINGFIDLVAKK